MSRRIEIELTSTRPDGTWTWRAAGAREPKGVLDGNVLPDGSNVGDIFRAEAEVEMDGLTILSVTSTKQRETKSNVLDLLPSERPFQAVTQQLAERRGGRRDGDRPRRDGDRPRRDGDRPRRDGDRPARDGDRLRRDNDRPRREGGPHGAGAGDRDRPRRERRDPRPHFEAPPELPQRPKPKRLKPGRTHRNAVVADLPDEQRPVAERVLQGGIPAVRQAVQEQNARLRAEGKPEVGSGLVQMAEQLLPRLRVAEWLDRADAAKRDLDELDLRDLRSVVAAADDPLVAREESTRELAAELKQALLDKQEREYQNWLDDIDAAVGVGRVIRALKLSGQPPKAGVPFPAEAANRLAAATLAALEPTATADRWSALLEAVAFSPVRTLVVPTAKPEQITDDLLATVKRIGALLPEIAALFGVEPKTGGLPPRPLRPARPGAPAKKGAAPTAKEGGNRPPRPPKPDTPKPGGAPKADTPNADAPAADAEVSESTATSADAEIVAAPEPATPAETPAAEQPAVATEPAAAEPEAAPASEPEPAVEAAAAPAPEPEPPAPDAEAPAAAEPEAEPAPEAEAAAVSEPEAEPAASEAEATSVSEPDAEPAAATEPAAAEPEAAAAEAEAATSESEVGAPEASAAESETPSEPEGPAAESTDTEAAQPEHS
jgi:hypothetical protein